MEEIKLEEESSQDDSVKTVDNAARGQGLETDTPAEPLEEVEDPMGATRSALDQFLKKCRKLAQDCRESPETTGSGDRNPDTSEINEARMSYGRRNNSMARRTESVEEFLTKSINEEQRPSEEGSTLTRSQLLSSERAVTASQHEMSESDRIQQRTRTSGSNTEPGHEAFIYVAKKNTPCAVS